MRLSQHQRHRILDTARYLVGSDVDIRLFGSRLDDTRRGGDLDLLLVSATSIPLIARAKLKQALETELQLPVDILTYTQGEEPTPFQAIALHQARSIKIEDAA